MTFKTWAALLAYLRKNCAYEGDGSFESVSAFVGDKANRIEIKTADLTALHGKTVSIDISADAGEDVEVSNDTDTPEEVAAEETEQKSAEEKSAPQRTVTPTPALERKAANVLKGTGGNGSRFAIHNNYERKAYEAKIQKGTASYADPDIAEAFGAWARLRVAKAAGLDGYSRMASDRDISRKTLITGDPTNIGNLIPLDFAPFLIENMTAYKGLSDLVPATPMKRDTLDIGSIVGDFVPSWDTEGDAMTPQDDPDAGLTELAARKLGALVKISNEAFADSAFNFADIFTRSVTRGYGKKLWQAFIQGDGGGSYGGIIGLNTAVGAGGKVTAASATAFTDVTAADISKFLGKVSGAFDRANFKVTGSRVAVNAILDRLARTAGGATYTESASGKQIPSYQGIPIVENFVMPEDDSSRTLPFLYAGDFAAACKMGVVTDSLQIARSDQRYFDEDNLAFRFTWRGTIVAHDVGDASNSGGVVAFKLHA